MGKYLFVVCAIILFLGILKSKGTNRLLWFFTGIIFFQHRIVLFSSPTEMSFHRFLIFSLLIPEMLNTKKFFLDLKAFPIQKPIIIVFIGLLLTGILDIRHNLLLNIYRAIDMYIQTFFVIFLIYKNLKQSNDWNKLINFLRISAIILCVYGIYNFITKSNPYDNFISNSFNSLSSFEFYKNIFDDRFRINSFVDHPIYYGYILAILFLLIFNALLTRRPKAIDIVILSLIFFNLILTNSRTPLFAFLFGCVIYISTSLNPKMKLLISVISVIFLMGLYAIPFIRDKMNNTIGIFEKEENQVGGSNLKMRQMQLLASYKLFSKKPISGNGLYYIEENLGYSSNEDKSTSADELQGFESYIYILLIEQGLIGIITNFIFFGAIIFYFIKNRKISKEFTGLGLAIAIMFLTFSIATGTLGSWIITMGILGIIIKIVELLKASKQYALKITN